MARFTTLLALTLSLATAFAQTPAPVSFLWPTPVSFPIAKQQSYDVHANEVGITVVWDSAGTLNYALVGLNGRVLNRSTVASATFRWLAGSRKGCMLKCSMHRICLRVSMSICFRRPTQA